MEWMKLNSEQKKYGTRGLYSCQFNRREMRFSQVPETWRKAVYGKQTIDILFMLLSFKLSLLSPPLKQGIMPMTEKNYHEFNQEYSPYHYTATL